MQQIIALLAGILFGAGLAFSGMTDTNKVLGFLDLFGSWDASLLFVMASALLVVTPVFFFIIKWKKPLLTDKFSLPCHTQIDKKLLTGSMLFGIGWGLYGYCPGPAISSLVYLNANSVIFVLMMLLGMAIASKLTVK